MKNWNQTPPEPTTGGAESASRTQNNAAQGGLSPSGTPQSLTPLVERKLTMNSLSNAEFENHSSNGGHISLPDTKPTAHPEPFHPTPFPTHYLPPVIREFAEAQAAALPAPSEFFGVPALVGAGVAIGNSRVIQMKPGWTEHAGLYTAIVCDSGTMKSPALDKALGPLKHWQNSSFRTWTSDVTVERLGSLLQEHPRGLLLHRDELTSWVKAMNQYRGGKGGDKEFFLSLWSGEDYAVDRVGQDGHSIMVDHPLLSVIGAIPLEMLGTLDPAAGQADGFLPRVLYAWPEPTVTKWSDGLVKLTV